MEGEIKCVGMGGGAMKKGQEGGEEEGVEEGREATGHQAVWED